MKRKKRQHSAPQKTAISGADRMKRLGTCCGIAGFLLAAMAILLNYRQHLESWQVKLVTAILAGAIIIILGYATVWVWIYNGYQKSKK